MITYDVVYKAFGGNRVKKILSIILCVAVMISVLGAMPTIANAEADLSISVTVNPTSLTGAGNVTLNVGVTNNGSSEAKNVKITFDGTEIATVSSIASGASISESSSVAIAENQLNTDLKLQATYEYTNEAGETQSKSASKTVNIPKLDELLPSPSPLPTETVGDISVSATFEADKLETTHGGKINLTFKVVNTGDVRISDATISASVLNGGKSIDSSFSLDPGQSKTVNYEATIMKDYVVSPTLKYTANGEQKTESFGTIELKMITADMSISASADNRVINSGEAVNFTVSVVNTGKATMNSFKIVDNSGNSIPISQSSLAAGKSTTVDYSATFTESKSVSFTLTASDEEGNSQSFTSNQISIEVGASPSPSPSPSATPLPTESAAEEETYSSLFAPIVDVDKTEMKEPDVVTFSITLKNSSNGDFTNIVIEEPTLGTIQELNVVPANEEMVIRKQVTVSQSTSYIFSVKATDPTGYEYTYNSPPIAISVSGTASSAGTPIDTLLIVIIVIIVLILVTAVTLLIIMLKEKKKRKLEEEAKLTGGTGGVRTDSNRARNSRGAPQPQGARTRPSAQQPNGSYRNPADARRTADMGGVTSSDTQDYTAVMHQNRPEYRDDSETQDYKTPPQRQDSQTSQSEADIHARKAMPIFEVEETPENTEILHNIEPTVQPEAKIPEVEETPVVAPVLKVRTRSEKKRVFEDRNNF